MFTEIRMFIRNSNRKTEHMRPSLAWLAKLHSRGIVGRDS